MTERTFRILLGLSLIALLYFRRTDYALAYLAILAFEGITNWRVPLIVSKIRFGDAGLHGQDTCELTRFNFDAERALRFVVVVFLVVPWYLVGDPLWFFPWFVGFMLLAAGMTNICPMYMGLRRLGFR